MRVLTTRAVPISIILSFQQVLNQPRTTDALCSLLQFHCNSASIGSTDEVERPEAAWYVVIASLIHAVSAVITALHKPGTLYQTSTALPRGIDKCKECSTTYARGIWSDPKLKLMWPKQKILLILPEHSSGWNTTQLPRQLPGIGENGRALLTPLVRIVRRIQRRVTCDVSPCGPDPWENAPSRISYAAQSALGSAMERKTGVGHSKKIPGVVSISVNGPMTWGCWNYDVV